MKLIDLSHEFKLPMPVYPGDPESELLSIASIKQDGYADSQLTSGLHVGTHIDAPAHMVSGGKTLDQYPLERFVGHGVLVDARGRSSITADLLRDVELTAGDVVLVLTEWSQWYHPSDVIPDANTVRDPKSSKTWIPGQARDDTAAKYFTHYPVVTESFADRLIQAEVSLVGFDTPSPDAFTSDDELADRGSAEGLYPIHHQLFEADILIAENLNQLDQLANISEFEVIALPSKLAANAAPARVIARVPR